jgi:hypothetical protein
VFGYLTSIGVYAVGPALDRWDKTRYLLNFAGQRSTSYYLGIFLADFLIFEITVISIIVLAFVLNLTLVTNVGGYVFLCMTFFGFPFIALSYAIGYIFKNPETGYKFCLLFGMLTYTIPLGIESLVPSLSNVFAAIVPWISLNNSLKSII